MLFNCGPTYDAEETALKQWHDWWAWYPARIDRNKCILFETVERRMTGRSMDGELCYEYRIKE